MSARFAGLWRHPEFMKLWVGQTVSQFGSTVTRDALPLAAALTLQATPAQMGLLAAAGSLPMLLIGLLAGAWVDRLPRRPILIVADLGRALLLLSIPLAALLGELHIEQLYLVAALTAILSVFFDVAYRSLLPSLVGREQLVEGNSKLSLSDSVAEVGGSAIAGALVQVFTAPLTILIDAVSFLFSAANLLWIRTPEVAPPAEEDQQHLLADIREGLQFVVRQPVLRALATQAALSHFFGGFYGALYGLYVLRELGMSPTVLGLLIASGGAGAFLGALLAERLVRRFGLGNTLVGAVLLSGVTHLFLPLAYGAGPLAVGLLLAGQVIGDLGMTIYGVNEMSLRQSITPDRMLGRTLASTQVLAGGFFTVGVLVAGGLGDVLGLRPTMTIAALGMLSVSLWLVVSPVRQAERPRGVAVPMAGD
jgi:MFS family permease